MLEIRDLHKSYKGFKVLNGLYMNIRKGDVYGFLGRNGCGKTTTMNIVCNMIPKDEGEIILGEDGTNRIKIGYLPESPALFGYMNGYEYLSYIAGIEKLEGNVSERINEVLELTGMTEGGKRRIKGYSRGMNQRLGIAAAIIGYPELLILDEPTSALDPDGRAEVMRIIGNLRNTGCTILLCTHILTDVERVANRIGILCGGKMAAEGSINEIIDRYSSDAVEISLNDDEQENIRTVNLLKEAGFAKEVSYFSQSSLAVVSVNELKTGMAETVRFIADNGINIRGLRASQPTLEQVYLDIVGK